MTPPSEKKTRKQILAQLNDRPLARELGLTWRGMPKTRIRASSEKVPRYAVVLSPSFKLHSGALLRGHQWYVVERRLTETKQTDWPVVFSGEIAHTFSLEEAVDIAMQAWQVFTRREHDEKDADAERESAQHSARHAGAAEEPAEAVRRAGDGHEEVPPVDS